MANSATGRKTDIGPPHYQKFLPPIIQKNYGQWKSHEIPRPGVLVHLAESGDKLYTVRAGTPRLLSIQSICTESRSNWVGWRGLGRGPLLW